MFLFQVLAHWNFRAPNSKHDQKKHKLKCSISLMGFVVSKAENRENFKFSAEHKRSRKRKASHGRMFCPKNNKKRKIEKNSIFPLSRYK